jgi:hypothetical protein
MRKLLTAIFYCLVAAIPSYAGTIEDVRARGTVSCGVAEQSPGLFTRQNGSTTGVAADLCRLFADVILGKPDAVAFVAVDEAEAQAALQAGEVDVLLLAMRWTMADEVEQGVLQIHPLFVNGGSAQVFGPVVRQGDDGWHLALRWVVYSAMSQPPTAFSKRHIEAGETLGLQPDWITRLAENPAGSGGLLKSHVAEMEALGWQPAEPPAGLTP